MDDGGARRARAREPPGQRSSLAPAHGATYVERRVERGVPGTHVLARAMRMPQMARLLLCTASAQLQRLPQSAVCEPSAHPSAFARPALRCPCRPSRVPARVRRSGW